MKLRLESLEMRECPSVTYLWDQNSGDNNWTNGQNWVNSSTGSRGQVPTASDQAIFDTGDGDAVLSGGSPPTIIPLPVGEPLLEGGAVGMNTPLGLAVGQLTLTQGYLGTLWMNRSFTIGSAGFGGLQMDNGKITLNSPIQTTTLTIDGVSDWNSGTIEDGIQASRGTLITQGIFNINVNKPNPAPPPKFGSDTWRNDGVANITGVTLIDKTDVKIENAGIMTFIGNSHLQLAVGQSGGTLRNLPGFLDKSTIMIGQKNAAGILQSDIPIIQEGATSNISMWRNSQFTVAAPPLALSMDLRGGKLILRSGSILTVTGEVRVTGGAVVQTENAQDAQNQWFRDPVTIAGNLNMINGTLIVTAGNFLGGVGKLSIQGDLTLSANSEIQVTINSQNADADLIEANRIYLNFAVLSFEVANGNIPSGGGNSDPWTFLQTTPGFGQPLIDGNFGIINYAGGLSNLSWVPNTKVRVW